MSVTWTGGNRKNELKCRSETLEDIENCEDIMMEFRELDFVDAR
jgi:hypothetical protein